MPSPQKAKGSGTYWRQHLKVHGHDYSTEILKECSSAEELKKWGMYYSTLWNVVESAEWANLTTEDGSGGRDAGFTISEEHKKNLSKAKTGLPNPKLSEQRIGENNPMFGKKRPDITGDLHPNKRPEVAGKIKNSNLGKKHSASSKEKRSKRFKGAGNPMYGRTGAASPRFGKTTPIMKCVHCGKECAKHNFVKYHGDKCKFFTSRSDE
jgi:hypothetical protein